jgi:predicted O-methyltransferase YrrM
MKWLRQNAKDRFRRALLRPGYAAKQLLHHLGGADERFLASVTNCTSDAIRKFIDEPSADAQFQKHLLDCIPVLRETPDPIAYLYAKKALIQYSIVRALTPSVVVETGVANGISTSYLLLACQRNGRGHVHSIDINGGEYLPSHKPTGWIVPDYLYSRWSLMLGDAREMLPPLLTRLGQVDIFIHDSHHTYEHMMYEFQQAYASMRRGGFLLSDDVDFNSAFEEFVIATRPAAAQVIRGFGILKK